MYPIYDKDMMTYSDGINKKFIYYKKLDSSKNWNSLKTQRHYLYTPKYSLLGAYLFPICTFLGKNDRNCWFSWCNYILHYGVQNIYKLQVDFPLLLHYFLWLIAKVLGSSDMICLNINKFKCLVLLVEKLSIYRIYRILESRKYPLSYILHLVILFNIAFWYNNVFFGQVDGVSAALGFISLSFAVFKKPTLSLLFFILYVNLKF